MKSLLNMLVCVDVTKCSPRANHKKSLDQAEVNEALRHKGTPGDA